MSIAFWLEVAVAVLLLATVVYCFLLNRRLQELRSAQSDMAELMHEFTTAMQRAEDGLGELRQVGQQLGSDLDGKISAARSLVDELKIMVDSGAGLADRIERGLLGATSAERPAPAPASAATASESERELAEAMRRPR